MPASQCVASCAMPMVSKSLSVRYDTVVILFHLLDCVHKIVERFETCFADNAEILSHVLSADRCVFYASAIVNVAVAVVNDEVIMVVLEVQPDHVQTGFFKEIHVQG